MREQIPFLMEVVLGHRRRPQGRPHRPAPERRSAVLRETAQTPPEDEESFRDYRRWRYYNTNSLWIDLDALAERFADEGGLELPVIVNRKTVDPRDPSSPPVLQLESAMGAAIGSFPGARLLRGAAHPLRAGQDDRRPAAAALRRLPPRRRVPVSSRPRPALDGQLPFVALDKRVLRA